jgi:uncharacterized protein
MPQRTQYIAASILFLFFSSGIVLAQTIPILPGLPGGLAWQNPPSSWHMDGKDALVVSAGAKTDWFVDPFDGTVAKNAPILLFTPDADYVLSTRVALKFVTKWDAGRSPRWLRL